MSNTQLTIHISRTSVHVAEVLHSNQEIIRQDDFELLESTPEGYKKRLKEVFDNMNLRDDYVEYTMAWGTQLQTLVPLSVFNESSAKSVFQLMFGEDTDEKTIDFNRLMELSMVSVFEIPDWVKSFFIMRFPQIIFKHEHAMTLRALFQRNTFKRKIVVSFSDEYVNISLINKNELGFSNSFDFQTEEDILYHLLFVLEQQKLTDEEGEINFLYVDEKTRLKAEETKKLFEALKATKMIKVNTIDSVLKLQTLCV
ncbi:MAG TPA: DUF3822 family protein [Brumimicrobium sp.]|nr:DUF3822 family protein [Brumimicrobium sp.]